MAPHSGADQSRIGAAHVPRKTALYESRREREFYRYYEPIRSLTEKGPPLCNLRDAESVKNHQPSQSPDRALTAFCQLGALRLGTRRAMLFFFDSSYAYVLAEATRTLSLQDDSVHDLDDALWLGHSIIPRGYSVCEETVCLVPTLEDVVAGETKRNTIHIINDLEKDTHFCDRPFVTDGPRARFYAGVPITTPKGINIGAYCCLDDRKRDGLQDKDIAFLKDMASTIMTHLEMVRARVEHQRGTRMIAGLGAFIEGASSLRKREEKSRFRDRQRAGKPLSSREVTTPLPPSPTSELAPKYQSEADFSEPNIDGNNVENAPLTSDHLEDSEIVTHDLSTGKSPDRVAKTSQNAEDSREQIVASEVRTTFQRASDLVREAINVDGCTFLDATIGTYGGLVESRSHNNHSSYVVVSGADTTETEGENRGPEETKTPDKLCELLASSHLPKSDRDSPGETQHIAERAPITEQFLRSLLRRYPQGKVWNFSEEGDASSDDDSSESSIPCRGRQKSRVSQTAQNKLVEEAKQCKYRRRRTRINDGREIKRLFPGVRSLALVGMFDQSRNRWYAACAVWTYSALRLLSHESEIAYLSAFNDVILAEVHRIEAQKSDNAKSDFISSISHELRSPLHGILGSIECLQDQPTDAYSTELISQTEICSRTLLDIIDHLLDFSKINRYAASDRVPRNSSRPRTKLSPNPQKSQLGEMLTLDAEVALDEITEEVVEAAVYSFCCSRDKRVILDRRVAVVIEIDRSTSFDWRCFIPVGGWKRMCINLVSNALKYTSEGYIKVSLKAAPVPGERKMFDVLFSVTDTGRGMSRQFLENHLFRAFSQEDTLIEGTGLGMSLVSKIVKAMGGKIEVKSMKDVGTTMTVTVPTECSRGRSNAKLDATPQPPFEGLSIGILVLHDYGSKPDLGAQQAARTLLLDNVQRCCEHLGIQNRHSDWTLEPSSDIYLVAEQDLRDYSTSLPSKRLTASSAIYKPLIVLCNSAVSARQLRAELLSGALPAYNLEFIAQPCSNERLRRAIKSCLEKAAEARATSGGAQTMMGGMDDRANLPIALQKPTVQPVEYQPLPVLTKGGALAASSTPSGSGGQLAPRSVDIAPPEQTDSTDLPQPPQSEVQEDFFATIRSKSTGDAPTSPLPLISALAPKPAMQRADSTVASSGVSLLLVDDNQINLQLLVNYAKKRGHHQTTATDGMKAVEAYKSACFPEGAANGKARPMSPKDRSSPRSAHKPQFILMDINMPVLNGFEATRLIRAFEQQHDVAPAHIIALTGLGSVDAQQEAFSSGVDLFLTKPVRLKQLTKIIDELRERDRTG